MNKQPWLWTSLQIPGAATIVKLLFARLNWQISLDNRGNRILVAHPMLMDYWVRSKFLENKHVADCQLIGSHLKYIVSPPGEVLSPILGGDVPHKQQWALNLATGFKETRKKDPKNSFYSAIYCSKYNTILSLPGTPKEQRGDDLVLGTWLTHGLSISTAHFYVLSREVNFLNPDKLAHVLRTAGLTAPDHPYERNRSSTDFIHSQVRDSLDFKRHKTKSDKKAESKENLKVSQYANPFVLPGRRELEKFFNEQVVDIVKNTEKYKRLGIDFPGATIIHGPSGCGKTYAVNKLVAYLKWPCQHINSSSVASPYIHDTSKKISNVFTRAMRDAPSIIVIDEMESYLGSRKSAEFHQHLVEEVDEFLRRIPEAIENKVLIIGMTNMLDLIDPAILRQGRFDHKIELNLPDREDTTALVHNLISQKPTAADLDLEPIIEALTLRPISDTSFAFREAARLAVKYNKEVLDNECLMEAISRIPPTKVKNEIGFVK
ncbi:MAG: ATP-binding protein [Deltaproteobacteria bacterium]|nr:ATP-binding protein [Deltaproteobacteria bacterium]